MDHGEAALFLQHQTVPQRSQLWRELKKKILDRSAKVGVVGLGYVGLPLAVEMARKGYQGCAGINRHGVADERAAQERSSAPFWLRVMRLGPQGRG